MKPVVALVGRPNVGKSTLFNYLTRTRDALVDDRPGVTRDRLYGEGKVGGREYLVVDTGGIETLNNRRKGIEALIGQQVDQVLDEADAVVFVVDGRDGLTPEDEKIAISLRRRSQGVVVAANKAEGQQSELVCADFQILGLGTPHAISARRGDGITELMSNVLARLSEKADTEPDDVNHQVPKITVIGRPNVGKSTLINSLCHDQRVIVYDMPGTTRDSVLVPLKWKNKEYVLIDTAGVRRKSKINETIEKFSVVKTIQAVESAYVVILMVDAREGITDQDAALAGQVENIGRAMVIAINKWDGLNQEKRQQLWRDMDLKMPFLGVYDKVCISALHGSRLGELMKSVDVAYQSSIQEFTTGQLNKQLRDAVTANPPPLHKGRVVKLKYAHQGGRNPPTIVVHGNQVDALPPSYRRFLSNYFAKLYRLRGTRVRIALRKSDNPYFRPK